MGAVFYRDEAGKVHGFEIAGDAPSDDEKLFISKALTKPAASDAPAEKPKDETGILSAFGSGIARGWNSAQAGVARAGQALAQSSDDGFMGMSGSQWNDMARGQIGEGDKYYAPEGSFFEQEGLKGKTRFLAATAGQTIPSMLTGIGVGAATMNPVAGMLAGSAAFLPQALDETTQAQIDSHGYIKRWDKAIPAAITNAAIEGVSDQVTLGLTGVFKGIGKPILKEAVDAGLKGAFKVAAKKVGAAAATNAVKGASEEVLQSIVTKISADMPVGDDAAVKDYIESAVVGGLLEGVFGGAAGGFDAKREIGDRRKVAQLSDDVKRRSEELAMAKQNFAENDMPARLEANKTIDTFNDTKTLPPEKPVVPSVWADISAKKETENPPFTDEQYSNTIEKLASEKAISPDKIRKTMGVPAVTAKEIYKALHQRGDAKLTGSTNKYLRIINPAERPAGVTTKHLGSPAYRRYEVRPVDDNFIVKKDGTAVGSFKSIEEAQSSIDDNKLLGATIEQAEPTQYGVHETIVKKPSNKDGEVIEGRRLVAAFSSEAQAKAKASQLDPKYSPDTNTYIRQASEKEQADAAKASLDKELGGHSDALQQILDSMIGAGRAKAEVVPSIGFDRFPELGYTLDEIPAGIDNMVVEGMTTPGGKPWESLISLAQDVASNEPDPIARQAKLKEVLYHEVVHAIRNSDLLTEQEWDILFDEAVNGKVPGKKYTWVEWAAANAPDDMPANILAEEAIAEMVRAHLSNPLTLKPAVRSIIGKIIDFLKRLGRVAQGKDASEVIDLIRGGALASRDVGSGGLGARKYPGSPMFAAVPVESMYLKSYNTVADAPQEKASPQEWLSIIRKNGVTQEELKWLGLEEALSRGGKAVPKGDILDLIKANSIPLQVYETVKKPGSKNEEAAIYPGVRQQGLFGYFEAVMTIPNNPGEVYESGHWDEKNVVSALRGGYRALGNMETLEVIEIQSDWHQEAGRKGGNKTVPAAPFGKTWDELAFKRAVIHAIEKNVDGISFDAEPMGVMSTERWGYVEPREVDGEQRYIIKTSADEETMATKDQDITGIINFVTKVLRNKASAFVKQFGGQMQLHKTSRQLPLGLVKMEDINAIVEQADTPSDLKSRTFSSSLDMGGENGIYEGLSGATITHTTKEIYEALDYAGISKDQFYDLFEQTNPELLYDIKAKAGLFDKWVMPITPEMRTSVLKKGLPLFSAALKGSKPINTETKEFKDWFKKSRAITLDADKNIIPAKWFHYTTRSFNIFDTDRGLGAHFGTEKAAHDRMLNTFGFTTNPNAIKERDQLQTVPVYLSIQHPLLVEDIGNFNDSRMVGMQVRTKLKGLKGTLILLENAGNLPENFEGIGLTERKLDNAIEELSDIIDNIDEEYDTFNEEYPDDYDPDEDFMYHGNMSTWVLSPENSGFMRKIKRVLQGLGFDGALYRNKIEDPGSGSFIAFEPEQIKSIHNTGAFSPDDPHIMFSAAPLWSATAPIGQRVAAAPSPAAWANAEANIRYNSIAPALQKVISPAAAWASKALPKKYKVSKPDIDTKIEGTLIQLQDRMLPMGKLIDRIRANGGMVTTESDPYLQEMLMTGQIDDALRIANEKIYTPLSTLVSALNVTEKDATEAAGLNVSARGIINNYLDDSPKLALAELYLYAQHAKERNAVMAERNANLINERPEQANQGSGMGDAEADEILNWFKTKPFGRSFHDASSPTSLRSVYRQLIASTNAVRRNSGLIPEAFTGEDGEVIVGYEDYAPLRSFIDEHNEQLTDDEALIIAKTGKGLKIQGKEDKAALGRRSLGQHLIAHAILQNEEAIIRAAKNKVGQTFLALVSENPTEMVNVASIIGNKRSTYAYDRRTGQVRKINDSSMRGDPSVMTVKVGGDEVYIQIHDPRLAKTLTGKSHLGSSGAGAIVQGLLTLNRFLAAMRTSHNPEFLVSNFVRDLQAATVNISEHDIQNITKNAIKGTFPALAALKHAIRENDFTGEWGRTYKEFTKYGGHTAFLGLRDIEQTLKNMNDSLQVDYSGKDPTGVLKGLKAVKKLVDDYNQIFENGVRLSAFKAVRDHFLEVSGDPKNPANIKRASELAARVSKEVTVNFNRRGEMGPLMNALYLFYNAGVQGSSALIGPMIRSKKVRKIWAGVFAAGMMQDIIMSMLSPVDDDGQSAYDKIPDYVLEHNLVFMDPFGLTDRGYIKLPIPYLMNGIYNAGRAASQTARGGSTVGEGAASIIGVMADSLNPLGQVNSFLNFVAPTFMDPIAELYTNTNFSGAPIMPAKNPYGQTERDSQRYWNNTSPAYVSIADWIATVTGGDGAFLDGLVEWSPNQIDYMINFVTGGVGTFAVRAYDAIAPETAGGKGTFYDMVTGEDWAANDVPFFRRVYGNVSTKEDQQFYIENRDRVLRIKAELDDARKSHDSAQYAKVMAAYPVEYKTAMIVNKIENERRQIAAKISKIRKSPTLSDEKKAALIDVLKQRQQALIKRANGIFRRQ